MPSHIARGDSTYPEGLPRDPAAPAEPIPAPAELQHRVSGLSRHRDNSLARVSRRRAHAAAPPSRARGHCSLGSPSRNGVAILNLSPPLSLSLPPPTPASDRLFAFTASGRVFQGPNPSSQLRLYSPSSPHPTRLPMKRRIPHRPRPQTPLRSGSSRRPSVPFPRNTEPRCPRTQLRQGRRRPTTTIRSRASSRSEEL